jgi:hypothetical protein
MTTKGQKQLQVQRQRKYDSRFPSGMTNKKNRGSCFWRSCMGGAAVEDRIGFEGRCCYEMYPFGPDTEGEAFGEGL